jgi:hypothetical protein
MKKDAKAKKERKKRKKKKKVGRKKATLIKKKKNLMLAGSLSGGPCFLPLPSTCKDSVPSGFIVK